MDNKKFNPQDFESKIYDFWLKNNLFNPKSHTNPYTIILPPPNVTGKLHLGHAWDVSLQDTIIRYKRMNGFDALWIPGTDHAGIATQTKFEKILHETKNENRLSLGRIEFLRQLMEWKEEQALFIHKQWAKLGLSLAYDYEKFTMDDDVNSAVIKVFVELQKQGLIYRDKKIVNWDPILKTAISNIEVVHKQSKSQMYYLRYYNADKTKYLIVATTRPETMFGDVCLFINPNDNRYQWALSEKFINPANNELLPVICDEYIDISFGTGVMKCTPGHDFNDNALGKKHSLSFINIMNPDGTMNELCNEYIGLDRFECRKKLVKKLAENGLVEKIEEIENQVSYSERTGTIVEPLLSLQWFIKMKPLAQKIIDLQNSDDKVIFHPEKYNQNLLTWLNNIEDWCISRQLWWGHQLPIWYHKQTNEIYCDINPPSDIENWVRDEDVLDTWFSSGLWPLVTTNWPNNSILHSQHYPTDVLVTGYDIIFFWVSRMMMFASHFTGSKPFKHVLIHGLIRDQYGKKMSKSLGNGVDPMDVIEKYGADTLRMYLTSTASLGEDLNYNDTKVAANWNFLHKLWNGAQYVKKYLNDDIIRNPQLVQTDVLSLLDKWIINEFNALIVDVKRLFDDFNFVVLTKKIVNFVWETYLNTYLEFTKFDVKNNKNATIKVLLNILTNILKMLHPLCPFITETLYQQITNTSESIMNESYPIPFTLNISNNDIILANKLINIIKTCQKYRSDMKLKMKDLITINVTNIDGTSIDFEIIQLFNSYLNPMNVAISCEKFDNKTTVTTIEFILTFKNSAHQDKVQLLNSLNTQLQHLESEVARCQAILSNPNFISKAATSKVELEKQKLSNYMQQLEVVKTKINEIN